MCFAFHLQSSKRKCSDRKLGERKTVSKGNEIICLNPHKYIIIGFLCLAWFFIIRFTMALRHTIVHNMLSFCGYLFALYDISKIGDCFFYLKIDVFPIFIHCSTH